MTRISDGGVSEQVWAEAEKQFGEDQLAALVWAVVAINSWNRLAISTGSPEPGSYEVASDSTS